MYNFITPETNVFVWSRVCSQLKVILLNTFSFYVYIYIYKFYLQLCDGIFLQSMLHYSIAIQCLDGQI